MFKRVSRTVFLFLNAPGTGTGTAGVLSLVCAALLALISDAMPGFSWQTCNRGVK